MRSVGLVTGCLLTYVCTVTPSLYPAYEFGHLHQHFSHLQRSVWRACEAVLQVRLDPKCLDGTDCIRRAFRRALRLRVDWLHPASRYRLGYEGYSMTDYVGQADASCSEDNFKIFPPIVCGDQEVVAAVFHPNRHQCSTCYATRRQKEQESVQSGILST